MRVVEFTYKASDLLKEVTKRTSYLGRMRNTDQDVHLLDRLSLTEGEKFLFNEYIQEAGAETYNYMHAFGKEVHMPYMFYDDKPLYEVKESCGIYITCDDMKTGTEMVVPTTSFSYSSGTLAVVFPTTKIYKVDSSQFKYKFTCRFVMTATDTIGGQTLNITKEMMAETSEITSSADVTLTTISFTGIVPNFAYGSNPTVTEIKSLLLEVTEITPATPLDVEAGDYVYEEDLDGHVRHFKAIRDYNSGTGMWELTPHDFILLGGDWKNSIVYRLNIPCWQDDGMYMTVDNRIKEALVSYIIWRWFETVLPKEADIYEKKWKAKAYDIQMGLNSERKILRRKYKFF